MVVSELQKKFPGEKDACRGPMKVLLWGFGPSNLAAGERGEQAPRVWRPGERGEQGLMPGRMDARECPAAANGGSALPRGTGRRGGPRLLPLVPPAEPFEISDSGSVFGAK